MRAMVLHKPALADQTPLHLEDVTTPLPRPGQVRVHVRVCGVCHTDLHVVEGELPLPNDCCRRGLENLCEHARFTGYHVDGGYAEHTLVHEDYTYAIPAVFSDENAAPLLCAGVIGYRSYRLSGIRPGECLGLFGFGASAHLVLQLARHQGCEVSVFTRAQSHRDLAREIGASWVGSAEENPPNQLHAAIIFAPAGPLVPLALRHLRKGSTLALAGITMSPIPPMDNAVLYHERTLRSVANTTREDVRDFLSLAAELPLSTEIQIFDLAQANRALQSLKRSEVHELPS